MDRAREADAREAGGAANAGDLVGGQRAAGRLDGDHVLAELLGLGARRVLEAALGDIEDGRDDDVRRVCAPGRRLHRRLGEDQGDGVGEGLGGACEIGAGEGAAVRALAANAGLSDLGGALDLAGIERCLLFSR